MIFSNVNIFADDRRFYRGWLSFDGYRFGRVCLKDRDPDFNGEVVDCNGLYAVPGFVDIHFHGAVEHDFCDGTEQSIQAIADYEAKNGVLAICPATMTYPQDRLEPVMKAAAAHKNTSGADLIGINMEGPFISPDKVGAQNPEYVQSPNYQMLRQLDDASGGLVKLVDVAPEVDGCQDFIKTASKEYAISIAHTCATYDDAIEAFKNGATHLTHTYNAMPGITHRAPGPICAAADIANLNPGKIHAEIITDGHHIDPAAIRLAFRTFGRKSMVIISDSCEATGMPEGIYSLGGQSICKKDGVAVLAHDQNTIAASASNQYDCFKYAVKIAGISLEDALAACTINPASAIRQDDNYGSITTGKIANMLLIDKDLNIHAIYRHGKEL